MPKLVSSIILTASLAVATAFAGQTQTYTHEAPHNVKKIEEPAKKFPVRNVILMIGDGMGIHHLSAAWTANKGQLYIWNCPITGISKTWCADKLVTDSAASGTAMATGVKTLYHRVAVDPQGQALDSLVDKAAAMGKATGVVVTCELNDATPASFCANNKARSASYEIIGDFPHSNAQFIFGGGAKFFENRPDKRDIFKEMRSKGYQIARTKEEFLKLPAGKTLAVIAPSHLPEPEQRGDILSQATSKALKTLSANKKGFFLMVEGSKIDKEAHSNKLKETVQETLDFDRAAGVALDWAAKHPGTLVVITADHNTGGMAILDGNKDKGSVSASFSSGGHDGIAVPVYAFGARSTDFTGVYENTAIFHKILKAMSNK